MFTEGTAEYDVLAIHPWRGRAGAGLASRLGGFSLFVEGRAQHVYTRHGVSNVRSMQSVPVSFGVLF
jgi:hypothetical protein